MNRRNMLATMAGALAGARGATAADANPPLKFDVSVCLDSNTLLWVPLRLPGAAVGLMHRPLRRKDDGEFRSAVVRMPAGWAMTEPKALRSRIQVLVLSGTLALNDGALGANGYACLPAGSALSTFAARDGADLLLISDGPLAFDAASGKRGVAAPTVIAKAPSDRTTRVWQDPESGANTSLIVVPPGWAVEGPEYHPCQEEIFCITGDIAPDDIRIMKAGWFLWNPPYAVHGYHLHSTAGGMVLEWHDRAYSRTIYRG